MEVTFYSQWEDSRLRFAVIAAWCGDGWLFCRHRERRLMNSRVVIGNRGRALRKPRGGNSWKKPAQRPLVLEPVCAYSVTGKNRVSPQGEETFGMLFLCGSE